MLTALRRWWRYRRYLNAEVSRRQYLGYDVGPALHAELREQAREAAGFRPRPVG
jgi:hypothetical protein